MDTPVTAKPFVVVLSANESTSVVKPPKSRVLRSGQVVLRPGDAVGSHTTGDREELIIVLEGRGEMEADGFSTTLLEKGQVAYIPPQTQHNVFNRHSEILRYIYVVSPV
jgi:mannose-6-phosphate isomerase-like protein (cupin superfamily)